MNENIIRRTTALAISAALLASLVVVAAAPAIGANGPKKDFVAGGGQNLAGGVGPAVDVFQISAHNDGSLPGDAKGSMSFKRTGTRDGITAKVTCLQVAGNVAQVTGHMTKPGIWGPVGTRVVAMFVDIADGPDLLRFASGGYWTGTDGCYATSAPVPVTKGNVVVTDAP